MLVKKFLVTVLVLLSSMSFAETVEVWGRVYDYSCGYFSRRAADMSVTLVDQSLPYGTSVKLIAGFSGSKAGAGEVVPFSWADRTEVAAKAIAASTWEARIEDKTLHNRSEARFLDRLQFVLEIQEPGKRLRAVSGGISDWGYFETEKLTMGIECVQDGKLPEWRKINFNSIDKN